MTIPLTNRPEPIPGYRLLERLGRGGFGEVWKCEAPGGIHKAIKFVYGNLEEASENGRPAEQEYKALERIKQVRHPFILSLERYEVIEGQLMIVMELADRNLWDRYRECRTHGLPGVPREELLSYLTEAAEALDLMSQEHNLQHLDIKPQNLFLVHKHIKVADFGLVKVFEGLSATVTGGVTPVYAAPETFEGRVSRYCDQYSLAIVYQELLTSQRPFNGSTTRQLLFQHLQQPPDLVPLPEYDRPIVGRALDKKPDERYPSCTAFVNALRLGGMDTPLPLRALDRAGASGDLASSPARHSPTAPAGPASRIPKASELISRQDPSLTQQIGAAAVTMQRPDLARSLSADQLPQAPPEKTGDGCLMPALVIGVGGVGGIAVRQLRRAVLERFDSAEAVPHLRLLMLDTDTSIPQELAADRSWGMHPREVVVARLNRPTHYVNKGRDSGVVLESWLDQRLIFRLPRNPVTTGLRGLGRLAFWDYATPLEQRLRTELQAALEPVALDDAARQTGLGLRSNRPRVYLVTTTAGGSGSGMFLDLAYLVRHVLRKLGYNDSEVVGVLLLPPPDRSPAKQLGVANTYAALAELYHYSRPGARYELKVNSRQPPIIDFNPPLSRCLCLPLPADLPAQHQAAGQAAALVYRELFSPLGRVADKVRGEFVPDHPPGEAFCQTASVYRLSWPRRRLTRRTGLRLADYLMQLWTAKDAAAVRIPVSSWLDEQWEVRQLRPELVVERVQAICQSALGQSPDAKFDALIAPLEVRGTLGTRLDAWSACQMLDEVADLVGKPPVKDREDEPPALLERAVAEAAQALTAEYEQKLAEMAVHFIELPQYRLAGAAEAIRQLTTRLQKVIATYEALSTTLNREAVECYARLLPMIGQLPGLGTGMRREAVASEVVELLRAYPKKRYQSTVAGFVLSVYRSMLNTAPEYLREVNFCRERIAAVQKGIEEAVAEDAARAPALGPGQDVFPGGGPTIDDAANRLVQTLTPEELLDLDNRVQQQVRRQFKALVHYCLEIKGQSEPLKDLLIGLCEEFMSVRMSEANAADVFFQHYAKDPQASQRALTLAHDEAGPELIGLKAAPGAEVGILATPDSPSGDQLWALAREALPGVELLPANSPDEVVFYREVRGVCLTDLPQLGPQAREVYQQMLDTDQPPHARADVKWQLPPGR